MSIVSHSRLICSPKHRRLRTTCLSAGDRNKSAVVCLPAGQIPVRFRSSFGQALALGPVRSDCVRSVIIMPPLIQSLKPDEQFLYATDITSAENLGRAALSRYEFVAVFVIAQDAIYVLSRDEPQMVPAAAYHTPSPGWTAVYKNPKNHEIGLYFVRLSPAYTEWPWGRSGPSCPFSIPTWLQGQSARTRYYVKDRASMYFHG